MPLGLPDGAVTWGACARQTDHALHSQFSFDFEKRLFEIAMTMTVV